MKALCLWQNLCSWKNKKQEKVLSKNREKNSSHKNKEREPLCQEKKKIFGESNWYWRSFTLACGFRTQRSQKFVMYKVKNEVSFYLSFIYVSTSLDTKTLAIASNRNSESCLSNRCLMSVTGVHIIM